MLYWAVIFLIIALIAAILGFAGVATAAAGIANLLFYIFLIVFLVTLNMGLGRRGTRVRGENLGQVHKSDRGGRRSLADALSKTTGTYLLRALYTNQPIVRWAKTNYKYHQALRI